MLESAQSSTETKPCQCGKKMILISTGIVLTCYPPIYPRIWWCGGCGAKEEGTPVRGETVEGKNMRLWKEANGEEAGIGT